MSNVSVGKQLSEEEKYQLNNNISKILWLLKVSDNSSEIITTAYLSTAFAVNLEGESEGFLLTYADDNVRQAQIHARRYDSEEESFYLASIVYHYVEWGLALLRVDDVKIDPVGKLAKDGHLLPLQELHCIGTDVGFLGTFKSGKVNYECVDDVVIPDKPTQMCKKYKCDTLSRTPRYRMLGHLYNNHKIKSFEHHDPRAENCDARIPIIQLKDSGGAVGMLRDQDRDQGFEGSPLFNDKEDILGLVAWKYGSFQIAIHVSLLKAFLENAKAFLKEINPAPVEASGSKTQFPA